MFQQRWLLATLLALLFACQEKSHGSEKLPALGVMADNIAVAGISSGGYMAGQFHLAHSNAMSGLGIIAAGPYYCAENSIRTALGTCVKGEIAVPPLLAAARAAAEKGAIDSLESVRDDRVWLFHGTEDKTVAANVVAAARDFYAALTDASNVTYVDNVVVTHGLPTLTVGAECTQLARPYLNACGYDLAGQMLQSLRGELKPPAEARGRLIEFDQSEFGDTSLNANGYLYVSSACEAGASCRLLVFFHGCDQSAEVVGDAVVRGAGLNEWAETNSLVVLYPQSKSSRLAPMNPLGCWDWWGYTGEAYATRDGAQIKAVAAMVDRLTMNASGRATTE